ncbi:MAG: hypothetical protein J5I90_10840 [Caldilineales bacterium]|nr:hypothetical protein [Caldilineales bacterium]
MLTRGGAWASFATDIVVAGSGQDEQLHGIGYDCDRNQYLVVWHVDTGGGDTDIWGRRASANPFNWLGGAFPIAQTSAPERAAAVVFNHTDNDYLVVYERQLSNGDVDIIGQRVAGNIGEGDNGPDLKGETIPVATTITSETRPAVAYLTTTQQFLVVYEWNGDIWGQRLARYRQGDSSGEMVGTSFQVASDSQWKETQPSITASTQQSYFLVGYTYEFGVGDFDIRGQRVRGSSLPGNDLLGTSFDIASRGADETQSFLVFSPQRQTFLAVWQAESGINSDVRGLWMDAKNLAGNPAIGGSFEIAADLVALEGQPRADIDPINGDTVVVMRYASGPGITPQIGQVWLNPDPVSTTKIIRPLNLTQPRVYGYTQPRVKLCHNRPGMLIGYSARRSDVDRDAHVLATSRWSLTLPMVMRNIN